MSIAGIVTSIKECAEGAVITLQGEDRGQNAMTIINPPNPVSLLEPLIGCTIWGGSSYVLINDTIWADRIGYTRLKIRDKK